MYTKKKFSLANILMWTRWELLLFSILPTALVLLYEYAHLGWLRLPWTPIALVGTAVAFLIGFQSNAAYGRAWEARKIWGGIVNASRAFTIQVNDFVDDQRAAAPVTEDELANERRALVYRHLAWLTALRHAMRQHRRWEVFCEHWTNREWAAKAPAPERSSSFEEDAAGLLAPDEHDEVLAKTNRAAAILSLQSAHLRRLSARGLIWEFAFLQMHQVVNELMALQGKSERIKNFPYPRQFATLGYDFARTFIFLLPFGVVAAFSDMGEDLLPEYPLIGHYFVWASIPFCVIVCWVFSTMQRIGTVGENPFEGGVNDVPISTMARGIEIDMREMLGEGPDKVPPPLAEAFDGVQL